MINGTELRMMRLFPGGENAVVVAVDHGGAYGPIPGLEDFCLALRKFEGADALLMHNAMASHWIRSLGERQSQTPRVASIPKLIVRLNWSSNYVFPLGYKEGRNTQVLSVEDAVALGADAVLGSLFIGTGSEDTDTLNVHTFGRFVAEKRRLGMPLMGEVYPFKNAAKPEQFHEHISMACRIIAELGADLIKTFNTGERFAEIVRSTPIPILVLGAEKTAKEVDALRLAERSVQAGARGVVFGRNVIQARDPAVFLEALKQVVKKGKSADQTARELDLP